MIANAVHNMWVFFVVVAASVTTGCGESFHPSAESRDLDRETLRERWFATAGRHPDRVQLGNLRGNRDDMMPPELRPILDAYIESVLVGPQRKGKIYFVVQDEDGNQLSGVHVTQSVAGPNRWSSDHAGSPPLAPTSISSNYQVDGPKQVRWPGNSQYVRLEFAKRGFRSIQVDFYPSPDDLQRCYANANEMLERGRALPPVAKDGPIRIVMPPTLEWDPIFTRPYADKTSGYIQSPTVVRSSFPADAQLIVSGRKRVEASRVAERGIYALTNGSGTVLLALRLDRGNCIAIEVLETHTSITSPGGSEGRSTSDGPYSWWLYSKPSTAKDSFVK